MNDESIADSIQLTGAIHTDLSARFPNLPIERKIVALKALVATYEASIVAEGSKAMIHQMLNKGR